MHLRIRFAVAGLVFGATACLAQDFAPPKAPPPSGAALAAIAAKSDEVSRSVARLRQQGVNDARLVDVEVYLRAAQLIVRHGEFFAKDSAAKTLEVLERGWQRAQALGEGQAPWNETRGAAVSRGYRSRIDDSVQPYAVTLPATYGHNAAKKWRIDVVLHGRDKTLTEVKFLRNHHGDKPAPANLDHVRIDVFGRGNNAYRWAGETDVFEAIESFFAHEGVAGRGGLVERQRVVLRGFSMGGAGTWHIGLHHPDLWCCLGPGAGFTTTRGYIKNLPARLPDYQEACLHIYDAVDYAANAFHVPIVAYSGAKDPQKAAADNIERALAKLGLPMTHLIAPDLEHKFPPEWVAKADAHWKRHAERLRPKYPPEVRFVTYTLKYSKCHWIDILGLERHYQRASVQASRGKDGFAVKTENIRLLRLTMPADARGAQALEIDGQQLAALPAAADDGPASIVLHKQAGRWTGLSAAEQGKQRQELQKRPGLQGPIDDAFASGFVCVRGTGKPWHAGPQRYVDADLNRFQAEWSKYLRGDLPIKNDHQVTAADIADKHLILFGDPSSNRLISRIIDRLPLTWTPERVALGGVTGAAADHVPVLIYPNPLNPGRYVVLNSGHTFHAADFQGTNALLYPRLGDYALLQLDPASKAGVVEAGLFDEQWRHAERAARE